MDNIGIIGAGVSSLHLGIRLLDNGIAATIYSPITMETLASGRMLNSVAHQYDTILREREMGIEFWTEDNYRTCHGRHHWIRADGMPPLQFWGEYDGDERCIDYRMYLPRLMQEFEHRGGSVVYRSLSPADIDHLYEQHSLLAIGTGKTNGGFADFFPRIDELSIHHEPARQLCVPMYEGVGDPDPLGIGINISVGHGELIVLPMETLSGSLNALLFECKHDGELTDLMSLNYKENPAGFDARILEVLETHYTSTFERVDHSAFRLSDPKNLLQGCLTPITRRSWAEISNDKFALSIGDLRCTLDPVTGNGANLASYGAVALADHISEANSIFDKEFCEDYENQIHKRTEGTVNFNNAILDPPPHVVELLFALANNQAMSNDFAARFAKPETMWFDIMQDAQTCGDYMARFSAPVAANA